MLQCSRFTTTNTLFKTSLRRFKILSDILIFILIFLLLKDMQTDKHVLISKSVKKAQHFSTVCSGLTCFIKRLVFLLTALIFMKQPSKIQHLKGHKKCVVENVIFVRLKLPVSFQILSKF